MILRDASIMAAMARTFDPLIVDPPVSDRALQPASLELTLDDVIEVSRGTAKDPDAKMRLSITDSYGDDGYPMMPGQFLLASTVEAVKMPVDLAAMVNGKSTWGRRGLGIHVTAGFLDPGFFGTVTLELTNVSHGVIKLRPGKRICQLVFMQLDGPADRPYGHKDLGSHYQGQRGVTAPADL